MNNCWCNQFVPYIKQISYLLIFILLGERGTIQKFQPRSHLKLNLILIGRGIPKFLWDSRFPCAPYPNSWLSWIFIFLLPLFCSINLSGISDASELLLLLLSWFVVSILDLSMARVCVDFVLAFFLNFLSLSSLHGLFLHFLKVLNVSNGIDWHQYANKYFFGTRINLH